jgi:hypothetical protein
VKHSSRISLLKLHPHQSNGGKFYSERKENEILERAEQTFHETFSNDFFNLMENVLNSNSGMSNECDATGINSCQNECVVTMKVCFNLCSFLHKKTSRHAYCFCFSIVFAGRNPGR